MSTLVPEKQRLHDLIHYSQHPRQVAAIQLIHSAASNRVLGTEDEKDLLSKCRLQSQRCRFKGVMGG